MATPARSEADLPRLWDGSSPALARTSGDVSDNENQQYIAAFDNDSSRSAHESGCGRKGPPPGPLARLFLRTRSAPRSGGGREIVSYDLSGRIVAVSGMRRRRFHPFASRRLCILMAGGYAVFALRPGAVGDISLDQLRAERVFVWSQRAAGTYSAVAPWLTRSVYALTDRVS